MKNAVVSIVVPFYKNNPDSFKICIDSLLSQEYEYTEILLISDGACQNLIQIANLYSQHYKNVKFFAKENGGVSSARNYGIRKASGRYVLFVDSDDYIDNDYIARIMAQIKKNDNKSILVGGTLKYIMRGKYSNEFNKKVALSGETLLSNIINDKIHGSSCRYIFDMECIKDSKIMFNEKVSYMEDALFVTNYCIKSGISKVELLPTFYNYIKSENSSTGNVGERHALENIFRALDSINLLTDGKYKFDINDSKIRFVEGKLLSSVEPDRTKIVDEFKKKMKLEYRGGKLRYKMFIFALKRDNMTRALSRYYSFINVVRKIVGRK